MRKLSITFILTLSVWLIFAGSLNYSTIIIGIIISSIISLIHASIIYRLLTMEDGPAVLLKKIVYTLLVILVFIYDALFSAFKVSKLTFEQKPSFTPGIVKIKTSLNNLAAITILANLITLTPGTVVVDFDALNKIYYIHWINVTTTEEKEIKKKIIGKHEEWLNYIFS